MFAELVSNWLSLCSNFQLSRQEFSDNGILKAPLMLEAKVGFISDHHGFYIEILTHSRPVIDYLNIQLLKQL